MSSFSLRCSLPHRSRFGRIDTYPHDCLYRFHFQSTATSSCSIFDFY